MISFKLFLENQRRLQERRTIPLNASDPIEKNFEEKLDKDYDYADNIIRWYKNSKKEKMDSAELTSIYKTNLDNLIDLLNDYSDCVKKIKAAGKKTLTVNIKTRKGNNTYSINDLDKFNFIDIAQNFIKAVCDEAAKLSTVSTGKAKYQITNEDAKKIRLLDFSSNVALWVTEGPKRDTTNKLVYQLWQNVEDADSKMDRGDVYGNPEKFSPYCTHSENHWASYSKKAYKNDPNNYKQFWYLKKIPGVNYVTGDLTNKSVQKIFTKMKGTGAETLICMNDSINEMLDRHDTKLFSLSEIKFGNEVEYLQKNNFSFITSINKEFNALIFSEHRDKNGFLFIKNEIPSEIKSITPETETFNANIRIEKGGWKLYLEKAKKLKTVNGKLTCVDDEITSLEGCPEHITGDFYFCHCDSLRSLENGPKVVDGNFICARNKHLNNLKGMSDVKIGKSIDCSSCTYLKSLEGAPKIVNGDFNCSSCTYLKTLENGPEIVKGNFNCSYCENLEDLQNSPKRVEGSFNCKRCWRIKSLEGSPEYVGGDFDCSKDDFLKSFDDKPKHIGGKFIKPEKEDSYY